MRFFARFRHFFIQQKLRPPPPRETVVAAPWPPAPVAASARNAFQSAVSPEPGSLLRTEKNRDAGGDGAVNTSSTISNGEFRVTDAAGCDSSIGGGDDGGGGGGD